MLNRPFLQKTAAACREIWPICWPWLVGWLGSMTAYYWFVPYEEAGFALKTWMHAAFFGGWFLSLLAVSRLFLNLPQRRSGTEVLKKWTIPLIYGLFLIAWLLPVSAVWVSRANWGMVVTTEILAVFFFVFRKVQGLAGFNLMPVVWLVGLLFGGFLVFIFKKSGRLAAKTNLFFEKTGWRGWLFLVGICGLMLAGPLVFPKTRSAAFGVLAGRDPFSAFYYGNLKGKFFAARAASSAPTISDPNFRPDSNYVFDRKNVVIITLDALRADQLVAYGGAKSELPGLDSLIKAGFFLKIDEPMASNGSTIESLYSMFYSHEFVGPTTPTDRPGLPWMLASQGYDVHLLLAGIHRGWYGLGNFYGSGATTWFEGLDSKFFDPNDDRILLEGLDRLPDFDGKPAFFYVHEMSSHPIGTRWPSSRTRQPDQFEFWEAFSPTRKTAYLNHYLNGLNQADLVLKSVLKKLDEKGFLRNSIVWVVSDHGENLGKNGVFGHGTDLGPDLMRVPILVHLPEANSLKTSDFCTHQDIAPTTARLLGLPVLKSWLGESLTDSLGERWTTHGEFLANWRAVIHRTPGGVFEKYVVNSATGEAAFFDLRGDPAEVKNLLPGLSEERLRPFRERQ